MEHPRLHAVPPGPSDDGSPLSAARVRRRLTVEEVAARARLSVDDVKSLEEGRIYRFPSVHHALRSVLLYATALGMTEREARRLAGLTGGRGRWSPRRWLAVTAFTAAVAALAWFTVVPELRQPAGDRPSAAQLEPKLPPPWEIRVDVFNGTDVGSAATRLANEIGGPLAYRIGTVENADRLDYVETRVYYPPGSVGIAERLADELGVETAALPGGEDPHRLIVIVGRDKAGS